MEEYKAISTCVWGKEISWQPLNFSIHTPKHFTIKVPYIHRLDHSMSSQTNPSNTKMYSCSLYHLKNLGDPKEIQSNNLNSLIIVWSRNFFE